MKILGIISTMAAALAVLAVAPAWATDTHDYAKDEYAIIRDGLSPDRQLSLATHGDGEGGSENFHVWLMAEPAHRKIMTLDGIGSNNNLDTGPNAYHAFWSADSRHVAVWFRSDRHAAELNLYNVEGRRAHPIAGPSLFRDASGRDVGGTDDVRESLPDIAWLGSKRFMLKQHLLLMTKDAGFAQRLGAYGKVTDKTDDGRIFVAFSAEADCLLLPGNRYRIVDLRAGKFGD
jgi:hypothetical protein